TNLSNITWDRRDIPRKRDLRPVPPRRGWPPARRENPVYPDWDYVNLPRGKSGCFLCIPH
ncbi:MAG: hypothetical protein V3W19_06340, partial [Desulfatiglandales bacterium]